MPSPRFAPRFPSRFTPGHALGLALALATLSPLTTPAQAAPAQAAPAQAAPAQAAPAQAAPVQAAPVQAAPQAPQAPAPKRVHITGELIDTWCYVTDIMYARGTAHHQCAVWCAVGGIPVSIRGEDGKVYMILKVEDDDTSVTTPRLVTIQTHKVTVNGDLYVRDGVNYLLVNQVADDSGIVNLTHKDYGIVPFGE